MKKLSQIIVVLVVLVISGCAGTTNPAPFVTTKVVVKSPPPPILPKVEPIAPRPVKWHIVTPDNVTETFNSLAPNKVLFALDAKSYENLSLNINDTIRLIREYKAVIKAYGESQKR